MTKQNKIIIFILNSLILIYNIAIFISNNNDHNFKQFKLSIFKFSDYFNINTFIIPYNFITHYLNNKYIIHNNNNIIYNYHTKKKVKIFLTGFGLKKQYSFMLKWIKNKIDDEFDIIIDSQDPDYLIYNCHDNKDLSGKYNNAIRIALYTENIMADINNADYIIGNFHINYLDRFFKYTILFFMNFNLINIRRKEVLKKPIRTKFCAAVISNCLSFYRFRLKFITKLSKYKKVDLGGKCYNNIKKIVNNKREFLSNYKFSIAMENSNGDGYISEKILDSFIAGTIPIYYGDYLIDEFINPKTYILIKGEKDIDEKIEYIKKIDQNDTLYTLIMKEKPIINIKNINKIENKEISMFLKNIFRENKTIAYRRDDYYKNCKCKSIFYSFRKN